MKRTSVNEKISMHPVDRMMAANGAHLADQLSFAEFFAGIGLVHLGMRPLGWHCVYANDIDAKKKQMYESQFGKSDYYHVEDVWKTDQVVGRIPAGLHLATASFPCVDLSLAGNRKGLAGVQSGAFYGFLQVLQRLRTQGRAPRLVLVENVLGLLTSHSGQDFRAATRTLSKLGYHLDAFVLDAKYFVPQSRPRLFIIGCTEPIGNEQIRVRSNNNASSFAPDHIRPSRLVNAMRAIDLHTSWINVPVPPLAEVQTKLERFIDNEGDWWDESKVKKHIAEMHQDHRKRIEALKRSNINTVGTIYRRVRDGRSRSEIRTDGIAGCLRTPRGGSSKQIVFQVGRGELRMRWMSPREYARLQGAPNFPITVDRNQALFGFGDAVCVPAISFIAQHVLKPLATPLRACAAPLTQVC
jgi:DNA (cytosine-5)-methyltransferase 1